MTTSGTYGFQAPVDDLLTEAWERIGLNPAALSGDHARSARRSLQAALIDWTNRGLNLWQIDNEIAPVPAGVSLFAAPAGTADILDMWINVGGQDIALMGVSRDEFAGIPNKAQTGRPTQFWSERRLGPDVIHLWPVPDQTYTLTINRLKQPQDVSALAQTVDAPVLWTEALYSELAARLAEKFAPARFTEKRALAEVAYRNAAGENRERVPLTLMPDMRGWAG
jgi:hypothetical protein